MKTPIAASLILASLLVIAGCSSSPKSRIAKNQSEFNSYPADVQAAITKGEVRVGFTPAQVKLALGEPDRVLTRTSAAGDSEVWIYREKSSGLGLGLGLGFGNGPVGGGVGVSSSSGGFEDERLRVVIMAGRVAAVEQSNRK